MLLATVLVTFAIAAAQPTAGDRDLATQFPAEVVDCVVAARLDLSRAEETLKGLFQRLRVHPRCALDILRIPGDERARLVFIRGKEADVALVKKALAAMEQAASLVPPPPERVGVARVETGAAGAAEMKRRILSAAARAGVPLAEADFFVHPDGPGGSLFYTGPSALAGRVAALSGGLGAAPPPDPGERALEWIRGLAAETARSFGGLLSTAVSAAALLLFHAVLCRIPLLGARYRRSFRLLWEKLFASFKGQDLAWEIIKAAAGLGVAAASSRAARGAEAGAARSRALGVARAYAEWRGLDPDAGPVRLLLEAAVDAEEWRAARASA